MHRERGHSWWDGSQLLRIEPVNNPISLDSTNMFSQYNDMSISKKTSSQ
jgi:hypothetical protein